MPQKSRPMNHDSKPRSHPLDHDSKTFYPMDLDSKQALIFLEHFIKSLFLSREILQKSAQFSAKNYWNLKKNCENSFSKMLAQGQNWLLKKEISCKFWKILKTISKVLHFFFKFQWFLVENCGLLQHLKKISNLINYVPRI